jgi:trehalose/maltose hydrolase-like predicted phosphorylase
MTDKENNWQIEYKKWDPGAHPLQEALCTLGNGYFATRAALEMEKDDGTNYPATYLAGGYNRMRSRVAGRDIENEDLVNWPNWLYLNFRIGEGSWFSLSDTEILGMDTILDMKRGVLERRMRFRDAEGRVTSIESRRLVSLYDKHLAGISWRLTPVNWSGRLTIRSGIDGGVINNNVARYSGLNQDHVLVEGTGLADDTTAWMVSRTKQSHIRMAQACRTLVTTDGKPADSEAPPPEGDTFAGQDFFVDGREGVPVLAEKRIALHTSRDFAVSEPLTDALLRLSRAPSFDAMEQRHAMAWQQIWQYNDIQLDTSDPLDQLVLRLHVFHLCQTASGNSIDLDMGIPARGWHGEGYRGHIFWDELYILPFFNLHQPALSRSLLMYRYRRLAEACHAAREEGCRGARFPWQSGSNGREETQKVHLNPKSGRWLPDVSHLQVHINAAIAYNVWHYYQSTGDTDFLLSHGAELILATALYWSDKARFHEGRRRYEIRGVMGPDEYHTHYPDREEAGLDNNAYTNVMAVWVLLRALDVLEMLDEDCCRALEQRVGFSSGDVDKWKDISRRMFVPFGENGLIWQFEGYEKLVELDWDSYRKKHGRSMRLDRILESEGDSCNRYKASKQADVLMLFYLFSAEELQALFGQMGYDFSPDSIPENIEYYRQRTAHGSTLSQVIHAWVYARSHRDESWKRFRTALMSDFRDVQGGTTHEGIHLGAMAGTLDLVQRCYSGLEIREHVLWVNPVLPEDVREMRFHLRYRGHWMRFRINHRQIHILFDKGRAEPVTIAVRGEKVRFNTSDERVFKLK